MNKSFRSNARRLSDLIGKPLADAFKKQGFASREIVTRWPEIVGPEVAAHAEPIRMQWPRQPGTEENEPATLVLRVEGPAAIEIQHLSGLIVERVNRFFGWQAIDRLALRQAPLTRRSKAKSRPPPDPAAAERIASGLTGISDESLRAALGRLGAAVKRL
ncbi:MAG: DUF721 domain-containing protein [Xanthobacteraceae bacterium]